MAKTTTYTTAQLNAAKRVIKSAERYHLNRPQIHGAWSEDGKQCFMDGFRCFRLFDALPLDQVLTTEPGDRDLRVSRFIDAAHEANHERLILPTLKYVKDYIKDVKATRREQALTLSAPIPYDFGDDLPLVNAQYLVDMLELIPDAKQAWLDPDHPTTCPIYISTGIGEAILMPIRKPC